MVSDVLDVAITRLIFREKSLSLVIASNGKIAKERVLKRENFPMRFGFSLRNRNLLKRCA